MPQAQPLSLPWHSYSSHVIYSENVLDDSQSLRPWALIARVLASWREVPCALGFRSKVRHAREKSWTHKPFLHVTLYTHYINTNTHIHVCSLFMSQSVNVMCLCNLNQEHQVYEQQWVLDCLLVHMQVSAAEGALALLFGHEAMTSEGSLQRWRCSPLAASPSQHLASDQLQSERKKVWGKEKLVKILLPALLHVFLGDGIQTR